jgi:ribosomal protein S14
MGIKKNKIRRDKVKRKQYLKLEFKKIILQSVLQNFNANEICRLQVMKKLRFLKKKGQISKQNNMCLITARYGGVYQSHDLSRHTMKKFAKFNMLHNISIKS